MLLLLGLLLTGCSGSTDVPLVTALQNTLASLRCGHTKGDVWWSRFHAGQKVILVSIVSGSETRLDRRFGSLADNSLVISAVRPSDAGMYFCNRSKIYLTVTADPAPVTPTPEGPVLGLGPTVADSEARRSSAVWVVPVGVAVGASLVLLSVLAWRARWTKSGERRVEETLTEVVYEEIQDVERPRSCTAISETGNPHLYDQIHNLRGDECVYHLAQNPRQRPLEGSEQDDLTWK